LTRALHWDDYSSPELGLCAFRAALYAVSLVSSGYHVSSCIRFIN
jgi:hypothetical protein